MSLQKGGLLSTAKTAMLVHDRGKLQPPSPRQQCGGFPLETIRIGTAIRAIQIYIIGGDQDGTQKTSNI